MLKFTQFTQFTIYKIYYVVYSHVSFVSSLILTPVPDFILLVFGVIIIQKRV